ncbi:DNA cytosine methyltransferase [Marinisporobacter balticus]|uniref:Cytosine-specific methyltransferase n=1 Tax=Marinisporobacter balticus TaxID=2018667 RepID=A0A4R2KER9_9FIRM|nr:DNA cytosine methyltransferase [Marinisporobacter balticus]TCO72141.1 DNA (cytosine-5)-methyltransferase 1 [Marinisporobacter balticus]
MSDKYNLIDLFCGCGGFSKGFEQAGFNIKLGLDSWKDATKTYEYNFPDSIVVNDDITNITGKSLLDLMDLNNDSIDVIIGGPPCQGFSVSGKRLIDDPRNTLYKSFVRIVNDIKPKIFVMENVPGLIRLFNGKAKDEIMEDFRNIGYNVQVKMLSADEYGVPQKRKRVFFVGVDENQIINSDKFSFPELTHGVDKDLLPFVNCKDAISDLDYISDEVPLGDGVHYSTNANTIYQKKMRDDSDMLFNHVTAVHKAETKRIISLVPDGGNYKDLPEHLKDTRKVNIAWTRMNSSKPSFTIDTGHNHHFHYRANRVPTARESARIQSFPDKFRFIGTKTSQLKQVGNAVPPMLAEVIATKVVELMKRG